MLCRDEKPLIVVENKVGATVTVKQLSDYGQWLGCQVAGNDWPGALVFLTHFTAPPDSFAAGDTRTYGVPWQHVCRWRDVWQWLNVNASSQPATPWQAFAKELADFLGEKEMTSETMTQRDLAALEMYLPSATRVNTLFNRIWREAVRPSWTNGLGSHDGGNVERSTIWFFSDQAMIQDWGYLRPPADAPPGCGYWCLAWGITFPGQSIGSSVDAIPPLPKRPYAYFGLFSQPAWPIPSDPQNRRWGLGDDWSVGESDSSLINARAMCNFDPDSDVLAKQTIDWIKEANAQLRSALPTIVRAGAR